MCWSRRSVSRRICRSAGLRGISYAGSRRRIEADALVRQCLQFLVVRRGEKPGQQVSTSFGNRHRDREAPGELVVGDLKSHRAAQKQEDVSAGRECLAVAHIFDDWIGKSELQQEILRSPLVAGIAGKLHARKARQRNGGNGYLAKVVVRDLAVSCGTLCPDGKESPAAGLHQTMFGAANARSAEIFLRAIAFDRGNYGAILFQHPPLRNAVAESNGSILVKVALDFPGIDMLGGRVGFQCGEAVR